MTGKSRKGGGRMPPEDEALWKSFTKDIKPLDASPTPPESPKDIKVSGATTKNPSFITTLPKENALRPTGHKPQLDFRTEQKLRRGKITIEARIDLHGFTQAQAHASLQNFLLRAYGADMRCVLVITGKGLKGLHEEDKPKRGVIKRMLPLWVKEPPLKDFVLSVQTAAIKDGGEGAFYIYLKRKRDY